MLAPHLLSRFLTIGCCCLLAMGDARGQAQPQSSPAPDTTTLDTVLVTGEQPGPGLWKVSKGDHVLWILGAQYPLPKDMIWRAADVEKTIAQSQQVIADATPKLELSFFHKLTLLPAVYGARKNDAGTTLKDVLPADTYARWLTLKAKYIGNDSGVERLRPMVAANELYEKALRKSGLARNGLIWDTVRAIARKDHVRIVEPQASIPLDDAKQTIRDFKQTTGSLDADCLAATMTRLETDLAAMRVRANAWAVGDVDALRKLPGSSPQNACRAALSSNPRLHEQLDEALVGLDQAWIAAAESALRDNASSFAVLPMDELLRPNCRLAMLAARGYAVEPPE
jgi:uncharacterized protein YbaP (TraB family)